MPKLTDRLAPEARAVLNGDCAGPPPGPRYRRHVAEQVAQKRARRPHATADHLSFRNADGTISHICICICDDCWPPGVKHPGACPDWNDEDV